MTTIHAGGFGTPTQQDQRPWLWTSSIICCGYSVLAVAARLLAKWELLGAEDAVLGLAYVCSVVSWAILDRSIKEGLGLLNFDGKEAAASVSRLFLSSRVVLICAVYLSKISVLLFERRIFSGSKKQNQRLFDAIIVLTGTLGLASIIAAAANCNFAATFANTSAACPFASARGTTIAVLDAITEAIIIALPTYFIMQNTVNRSSKVTVILLFGFRLPCIPFAATATSYLNSTFNNNVDRDTSIASAVVWLQVLLGWSLTSASVPCMKSFLSAFLADGIYRVYDTQSGTHVSRTGGTTGPTHSAGIRMSRTGMGSAAATKSNARRDDADSIDSDGSQRIMIERSAQIDVAIEDRKPEDDRGNSARTRFPYQGP